jgi:hypothetical protein
MDSYTENTVRSYGDLSGWFDMSVIDFTAKIPYKHLSIWQFHPPQTLDIRINHRICTSSNRIRYEVIERLYHGSTRP